MTRLFSLPFALLVLCAFCPLTAVVADEEAGTFTDLNSAGPDYSVQGEYQGTLSVDGQEFKYALQVIALGDHKFDAVGYMGGLPGEGWTGEEKVRASGQTANGVTTVVSDHGSATISGGKATLKLDNGTEIGTLNRIERKSPTLGAKPPAGATVLFDGKSADQFERGRIVMDDLLAADCESHEKLGDHRMHIEFRTPFKPAARGQARGNSGVYLQGRYECQVLDSFGLEGENNECGGIYSIAKPDVNACFPPLTWQTYDVEFTAARWQDGKKVSNARVTIRQNGILIHDDIELPHGTPGKFPEEEGPAALYLQGHGNPVVYRNIWFTAK
ncbi:MAG: DUF1080 domain-containing protein [Planctomycetaceae bacterium]